jgi:hypothetical protein
VLSFVKECVQLSFKKKFKNNLLPSPRNIGVHTTTPEYASTACISTVLTMPFYVKPFEKKVFEEVFFLLKYHQNLQVFKRRNIEKREKVLKKEKEEEKKSSKSLFK